MRGYFLTNMYLSPIQHGIQAAHCLQEINNNFPRNKILKDWAENHKTMYVLNGGTSEQMRSELVFFTHISNNLPWATFYEPSIDNALTCIGIIVPETIYNPSEEWTPPWSFETELSKLLKSKSFAR